MKTSSKMPECLWFGFIPARKVCKCKTY